MGMLCLLLPVFAFAQFGQNKVTYIYSNWESIKTPHFEIFFPDGGYDIAVETAEYAELSYRYLSRKMDYELEADDRITIITHRSHNQFQQTNVSTEEPDEAEGGFTEYLKSRVVIPYEGNWEKYRHVVHHELTHAMMFRKYFGHGLQSVINGITRMPMPLWYVEGMAEYESRFGWDVEADMFLRDAVVNDWLPPLDQLGGYLNYKGGQSVFWYLEQKYGPEKVTELISRVPRYRDFDRGVRASLGIDTKELSERWFKWIKNQEWSYSGQLESPKDFATPLTDHKKQENYINNAPSLSPQGDRIAFLSDRSDYFDIWLMNAYNGKIIRRLVSGERNAGFEELHWLQSGISWDPTGTFITFGAKAEGHDALYTLDTRDGTITHRYLFNLDGVYSPVWSPDGKTIAFQGWLKGKCDLYTVTLADSVLHHVTNDVFTDFEPSWTPDSKSLLFSSDRGDSIDVKDTTMLRSIVKDHVETMEIYRLDLADGRITRITHDGQIANTPVWIPNDSAFVYVSSKTGIYNLYRYDLRTNESNALTNVLTGVFQPSISKNKSIAFASFFDGGYDIYMMSTPLDKPVYKNPPITPFQAGNYVYPPDPGLVVKKKGEKKTQFEIQHEYANYIFDDMRPGVERYREEEAKHPTVPAKPAVAAVNDSDTSFVAKDYKVHLTPDLLFASAGYSNLVGFQGNGQFLLSDVLGNHVIYISTDLYYDIENTNIDAMYYNLSHRTNYGIGGFHNVYFFNYGWTRDRSYGVTLEAQYPLSKYMRFDFTTNFINIIRSQYTLDNNDYITLATRHVLLPGISFVKDNSVWGYAGPANGERYQIAVDWSPDFDNNPPTGYGTKWGMDFKTLTFDYRRYMRVSRDYGFAVRVSGGGSEGKSAQRFFLGGESNSLNRALTNTAFVRDVDNVFFSTLVTPLRGMDLYEVVGTRYALTNLEFRYPLIRMLALGFPLPAFFYNIRGASFIDMGGVWDKNLFRGSVTTPSGATQLRDMNFGFGVGARANIGFAILRYDLAWRSDWISTMTPQHYVSFGTEF